MGWQATAVIGRRWRRERREGEGRDREERRREEEQAKARRSEEREEERREVRGSCKQKERGIERGNDGVEKPESVAKK